VYMPREAGCGSGLQIMSECQMNIGPRMHTRLVGIVLVMNAVGCQAATPNDPSVLLIPPDAQNIVVAPGSNDHAFQKSFSTEAAYPEVGIAKHSFESLKRGGWSQCLSKYDDWMNYEDRSNASPTRVYRRVQHWKQGSRALELLFTFRQPTTSATEKLTNQRVTISYQEFPSPDSLRSALKGKSVTCP
jgi:hypothetical protein